MTDEIIFNICVQDLQVHIENNSVDLFYETLVKILRMGAFNQDLFFIIDLNMGIIQSAIHLQTTQRLYNNKNILLKQLILHLMKTDQLTNAIRLCIKPKYYQKDSINLNKQQHEKLIMQIQMILEKFVKIFQDLDLNPRRLLPLTVSGKQLLEAIKSKNNEQLIQKLSYINIQLLSQIQKETKNDNLQSIIKMLDSIYNSKQKSGYSLKVQNDAAVALAVQNKQILKLIFNYMANQPGEDVQAYDLAAAMGFEVEKQTVDWVVLLQYEQQLKNFLNNQGNKPNLNKTVMATLQNLMLQQNKETQVQLICIICNILQFGAKQPIHKLIGYPIIDDTSDDTLNFLATSYFIHNKNYAFLQQADHNEFLRNQTNKNFIVRLLSTFDVPQYSEIDKINSLAKANIEWVDDIKIRCNPQIFIDFTIIPKKIEYLNQLLQLCDAIQTCLTSGCYNQQQSCKFIVNCFKNADLNIQQNEKDLMIQSIDSISTFKTQASLAIQYVLRSKSIVQFIAQFKQFAQNVEEALKQFYCDWPLFDLMNDQIKMLQNIEVDVSCDILDIRVKCDMGLINYCSSVVKTDPFTMFQSKIADYMNTQSFEAFQELSIALYVQIAQFYTPPIEQLIQSMIETDTAVLRTKWFKKVIDFVAPMSKQADFYLFQMCFAELSEIGVISVIIQHMAQKTSKDINKQLVSIVQLLSSFKLHSQIANEAAQIVDDFINHEATPDMLQFKQLIRSNKNLSAIIDSKIQPQQPKQKLQLMEAIIKQTEKDNISVPLRVMKSFGFRVKTGTQLGAFNIWELFIRLAANDRTFLAAIASFLSQSQEVGHKLVEFYPNCSCDVKMWGFIGIEVEANPSIANFIDPFFYAGLMDKFLREQCWYLCAKDSINNEQHMFKEINEHIYNQLAELIRETAIDQIFSVIQSICSILCLNNFDIKRIILKKFPESPLVKALKLLDIDDFICVYCFFSLQSQQLSSQLKLVTDDLSQIDTKLNVFKDQHSYLSSTKNNQYFLKVVSQIEQTCIKVLENIKDINTIGKIQAKRLQFLILQYCSCKESVQIIFQQCHINENITFDEQLFSTSIANRNYTQIVFDQTGSSDNQKANMIIQFIYSLFTTELYKDQYEQLQCIIRSMIQTFDQLENKNMETLKCSTSTIFDIEDLITIVVKYLIMWKSIDYISCFILSEKFENFKQFYYFSAPILDNVQITKTLSVINQQTTQMQTSLLFPELQQKTILEKPEITNDVVITDKENERRLELQKFEQYLKAKDFESLFQTIIKQLKVAKDRQYLIDSIMTKLQEASNSGSIEKDDLSVLTQLLASFGFKSKDGSIQLGIFSIWDIFVKFVTLYKQFLLVLIKSLKEKRILQFFDADSIDNAFWDGAEQVISENSPSTNFTICDSSFYIGLADAYFKSKMLNIIENPNPTSDQFLPIRQYIEYTLNKFNAEKTIHTLFSVIYAIVPILLYKFDFKTICNNAEHIDQNLLNKLKTVQCDEFMFSFIFFNLASRQLTLILSQIFKNLNDKNNLQEQLQQIFKKVNSTFLMDEYNQMFILRVTSLLELWIMDMKNIAKEINSIRKIQEQRALYLQQSIPYLPIAARQSFIDNLHLKGVSIGDLQEYPKLVYQQYCTPTNIDTIQVSDSQSFDKQVELMLNIVEQIIFTDLCKSKIQVTLMLFEHVQIESNVKKVITDVFQQMENDEDKIIVILRSFIKYDLMIELLKLINNEKMVLFDRVYLFTAPINNDSVCTAALLKMSELTSSVKPKIPENMLLHPTISYQQIISQNEVTEYLEENSLSSNSLEQNINQNQIKIEDQANENSVKSESDEINIHNIVAEELEISQTLVALQDQNQIVDTPDVKQHVIQSTLNVQLPLQPDNIEIDQNSQPQNSENEKSSDDSNIQLTVTYNQAPNIQKTPEKQNDVPQQSPSNNVEKSTNPPEQSSDESEQIVQQEAIMQEEFNYNTEPEKHQTPVNNRQTSEDRPKSSLSYLLNDLPFRCSFLSLPDAVQLKVLHNVTDYVRDYSQNSYCTIDEKQLLKTQTMEQKFQDSQAKLVLVPKQLDDKRSCFITASDQQLAIDAAELKTPMPKNCYSAPALKFSEMTACAICGKQPKPEDLLIKLSKRTEVTPEKFVIQRRKFVQCNYFGRFFCTDCVQNAAFEGLTQAISDFNSDNYMCSLAVEDFCFKVRFVQPLLQFCPEDERQLIKMTSSYLQILECKGIQHLIRDERLKMLAQPVISYSYFTGFFGDFWFDSKFLNTATELTALLEKAKIKSRLTQVINRLQARVSPQSRREKLVMFHAIIVIHRSQCNKCWMDTICPKCSMLLGIGYDLQTFAQILKTPKKFDIQICGNCLSYYHKTCMTGQVCDNCK